MGAQQRLTDRRYAAAERIGHINGILSPAPLERNPENTPGACQRPPPAAATRSPCWRLPQHAAAARRSSAQPGVARRSSVWTGGSGEVRMASQGFAGGEGLGAARWENSGGRDFKGISNHEGATYTVAARTSPMNPGWRGRRRTRIALGGGGPGRWEVERRPA
jgi:hypothetical protein